MLVYALVVWRGRENVARQFIGGTRGPPASPESALVSAAPSAPPRTQPPSAIRPSHQASMSLPSTSEKNAARAATLRLVFCPAAEQSNRGWPTRRQASV